MKIESHNLFVVINIFGAAFVDYSVFTNYAEALTDATTQGIVHNDNETQYEAISLPFYQWALMGNGTLLEAYNLYCKE